MYVVVKSYVRQKIEKNRAFQGIRIGVLIGQVINYNH